MSSGEIVFVLGVHRSGTSAAAELLASIGYSVPGTTLDSNFSVNAHGFWESKEVVDINERILNILGLNWFDVFLLKSGWENHKNISPIKKEAKKFIKNALIKNSNLVIKDPRICVLMPFWLSCIGDASYKSVFIYRDPLSVALSLQKRDGLSLLSGYLLWLTHALSAVVNSGQSGCLILDYDRLLDNENSSIEIAKYFSIKSIPSLVWQAVFVPELRHSKKLSGLIERNDAVSSMANKLAAYFSHGHLLTPERLSFFLSELSELAIFLESNSLFIDEITIINRDLLKSLGDASRIGAMHAEALNVIQSKDAMIASLGHIKGLYEHSIEVIADRENKISALSDYLGVCETRLKDLHAALAEFDAVRLRLGEVESTLQERDADMARNAAYIIQCECRLVDLHAALAEFEAVRLRLGEVESTLQERDADMAHNAAYIAQCESRLADLHTALAEFEAVRLRLSEVESTLQERDTDMAHNATYIAQCESRLSDLHDALAEFEAVRLRLGEVESTLQERDADMAHNAAYIAQCEARLSDLHAALAEFEAVRARLAEVETALQLRNDGLVQNTDYIAQCERRIQELELALLEFEAVRSRLAEVESTLQQRDLDIENNAAYIAKCSARIAEQDDAIAELEAVKLWSQQAEITIAHQGKQLADQVLQLDILQKDISKQLENMLQLSTDNQFLQQDIINKSLEIAALKNTISIMIENVQKLELRLDGLLSKRVVRYIERYLLKKVY